MNENINLCEILKDCPKGTKLYSPMFGEVKLLLIDEKCPHPIVTYVDDEYNIETFCEDGRYSRSIQAQECMLYPSNEQRDWTKFNTREPKFDPNTFQPFDRVLVQYAFNGTWRCEIFSHIVETNCFVCSSCVYKCIIPYNEDTKQLVGTTGEAPEYYRYWED